MKRYPLNLATWLVVVFYSTLALFSLFAVVIALGFGSESTDKFPAGLGLLMLLVLAHMWYTYLQIPHTITWGVNGTIEFKSALKTVMLAPHEITAIAPEGYWGFLVIRSPHRKVLLVNRFDGFHEFLTQLKAANPTVELRGC